MHMIQVDQRKWKIIKLVTIKLNSSYTSTQIVRLHFEIANSCTVSKSSVDNILHEEKNSCLLSEVNVKRIFMCDLLVKRQKKWSFSQAREAQKVLVKIWWTLFNSLKSRIARKLCCLYGGTGKVWCTTSWWPRPKLLIVFNVYCDQLNKLSAAIHEKLPILGNRNSVVFYHDECKPHTSLQCLQNVTVMLGCVV